MTSDIINVNNDDPKCKPINFIIHKIRLKRIEKKRFQTQTVFLMHHGLDLPASRTPRYPLPSSVTGKFLSSPEMGPAYPSCWSSRKKSPWLTWPAIGRRHRLLHLSFEILEVFPWSTFGCKGIFETPREYLHLDFCFRQLWPELYEAITMAGVTLIPRKTLHLPGIRDKHP